MKLSTTGILLGIWLIFVCNKSATGNILHDIKEIIKDIFNGEDEGDKKDVERVRKTMAEWKSCLGVSMPTTELDHINHDCDDEFDITNEHDKKKKGRVQNSACYRVCQIELLGWLHDSDSEHTSGPYFNHTAMESFVAATFPESIQKMLKNKISNCARNMESFSDEKACKNYKQFFKCLDKSIHDKCRRRGTSRGGGGGKGDSGNGKGDGGNGKDDGGDEAETTTEPSADEEEEETTTSGDDEEERRRRR